MYLTLVLTLIGILLMLVIGVNVAQQYKKRVDNQKRQELSKQKMAIDDGESILANISILPISNNVVMILYGRIEEGLLISKKVSGSNQYDQRINVIRGQMQNLRNTPPKARSIDNFQIPNSEKEVLIIVQTLKKLKEILRLELQKGRIPQHVYGVENQKIAHMQLRINIDNTISRAQMAFEKNQFRTAKQMLTKAVNTLNSLERKNPDDTFVKNKLELARKMLSEVINKEQPEMEARQSRLNKPEEPEADDEIFGDRKKW
ncbi:MAG: hypothetical protein ISP86_05175 [Shewanellaceae bacterium]|nr:hypothetical protein [Shewanellaceae bacterium]